MFNFVKRHKILCIVLPINAIVIVIAIVFIVTYNSKTAIVDLKVAPNDAIIEIDGENYENSTEISLAPGEHSANIHMDGMQTRTVDFTLADNEFYHLHTYLLSEDGTFSYYETHPSDAFILTQVGDEDSAEYISDYQKRYSITQLLPINFDDYRDDYAYYTNYEIVIDSEIECEKIVCLKIIDHTENSDKLMMDKIRELGYNPDDYGLRYIYEPQQSVKAGDDE